MKNEKDLLVWEDQPSWGPIVPSHIARSGMDAGAFQLLVVLMTYRMEGKHPFQRELAEDMNVTARTVRNKLAELDDLGLVSRQQNGVGRPCTFRLHLERQEGS